MKKKSAPTKKSAAKTKKRVTRKAAKKTAARRSTNTVRRTGEPIAAPLVEGELPGETQEHNDDD